MNFFKKLFTKPSDDDIVEYWIDSGINSLTYESYFVLLYKTKYCIYYKTVKHYCGLYGDKEFDLMFYLEIDGGTGEKGAIKFVREHPTYGSIKQFEKESLQEAIKERNRLDKEKYPKKIN